MSELAHELEAVAAETGFAGVVHVDRGGETRLAQAYGLAHRGWEIPNTIDTRFALASGAKGLTALAVVSLIEAGTLELATNARLVLDADLPLVADDVTVEQLLSHRSGIGDYLDEDEDHDLAEYLMPVSVHELAATEDFLAVLDGHETKFPAGERFSYSNGGYVVLALIAERASGVPFHELVRRRVCEPAGMGDTEFLRSDEPPGRTALGYLEVDGAMRTNVFHLPVRGTGDGGVYSTATDIASLWSALFAGRIVSSAWVAEMTRPRSDAPGESMQYGLGFWLQGEAVRLVGCDAGVSFSSTHDPATSDTYTVISNSTDGAWPLAKLLQQRLTG